jgi:hypothetical protein
LHSASVTPILWQGFQSGDKFGAGPTAGPDRLKSSDLGREKEIE